MAYSLYRPGESPLLPSLLLILLYGIYGAKKLISLYGTTVGMIISVMCIMEVIFLIHRASTKKYTVSFGGFQALKIKVGLPDLEDMARIEAIRSLLGHQYSLMVDANYSLVLIRLFGRESI